MVSKATVWTLLIAPVIDPDTQPLFLFLATIPYERCVGNHKYTAWSSCCFILHFCHTKLQHTISELMAFTFIPSTCGFHDSFSSRITPRSLEKLISIPFKLGAFNSCFFLLMNGIRTCFARVCCKIFPWAPISDHIESFLHPIAWGRIVLPPDYDCNGVKMTNYFEACFF